MPIINLSRSQYFPPPGWRGFGPRYGWTRADLTANMAGYSVQRTNNPPPPAPKLDIILLHGDRNVTFPMAGYLKRDLGNTLTHIDIHHLLWEINALPDGKQKSQALGLLHPLPLKRYINRQTRYLSPRLIIEEVLFRHITALVATGVRSFIITGFTEFYCLYYFQLSIAKPDAVIWLEEQAGWDAKEWMTRFFGEGKCIFLNKYGCTCMEGLYGKLLGAMGEKAAMLPAKGVVRDDAKLKPRNEMVVMLANAILRGKVEDKGVMSEDEMLLDDEIEGSVKVEREDSPMTGGHHDAEDGYDVAMDLLQGLDEYARSGNRNA